jgi:hypothetical protein
MVSVEMRRAGGLFGGGGVSLLLSCLGLIHLLYRRVPNWWARRTGVYFYFTGLIGVRPGKWEVCTAQDEHLDENPSDGGTVI